MTKKGKKDFDEVLLESIDEAFSALGENAKQSIYFHLEKEFFIDKRGIPYKIDDFSNALERIFGLGDRHLEILIMKRLHQRISCQYHWEGPKWLIVDLTFSRYIQLAEICFQEERVQAIETFVIEGEKVYERL